MSEIIAQTSILSKRGVGKSFPADLRVLLNPFGQLRYSMQQLHVSIQSGEEADSRARIKAFQRFSERYWPGWFEGAVRSAMRAPDIIALLCDEAANVASCEAIRSLLTWAPSGSNAAEIEDLQDALCYTNQAVIGIAEPSTPDLTRIICSAQRARHCFDEIEQGGGAVPEALSRKVDQLEASLQALQSSLTPDAVDQLVSALGAMGQFVSATKGRLRDMVTQEDAT
jgi:hypothetical protein